MTPDALHRPALILTALIALAIAGLSFVPVVDLPAPAQPQTTRAAMNQHMLAYAVLVLPAIATRPAAALWLAPAAFGFGVLIEFVQPFVGRERSVGDMIANSIGIATGAALALAAHVLLARLRR
jgi:VanZ family protein